MAGSSTQTASPLQFFSSNVVKYDGPALCLATPPNPTLNDVIVTIFNAVCGLSTLSIAWVNQSLTSIDETGVNTLDEIFPKIDDLFTNLDCTGVTWVNQALAVIDQTGVTTVCGIVVAIDDFLDALASSQVDYDGAAISCITPTASLGINSILEGIGDFICTLNTIDISDDVTHVCITGPFTSLKLYLEAFEAEFCLRTDVTGLNFSCITPPGTITINTTFQAIIDQICVLDDTDILDGTTYTNFTGGVTVDLTLKNIDTTIGTIITDITNLQANALPAGTAGDTLRFDGANWIANSFIFNSGTLVGINTSTPEEVLDVFGNLQVRRIADADAGNTLRNSNILIFNGAFFDTVSSVDVEFSMQQIVLTTAPTSRLDFNFAGSPLVSILDTGEMGLGTITPGASITVKVPIGANPALRLEDGDITHGMTTLPFSPVPTTNTVVQLQGTGSGGGRLIGITDINNPAIIIHGIQGVVSPTVSANILRAGKKNGTTSTNLANTEIHTQFQKNDGTVILTVLGDGSTGINVTPVEKLHIVGNERLVGTLQFDSSVQTSVIDDINSGVLFEFNIFTANDLFISTDNGAALESWISLFDTGLNIGFGNFNAPDGGELLIDQNRIAFSLHDGGVGKTNFDVRRNTTGSVTSVNTTLFPSFLTTQNSTINQNIINTVIVAGNNITAKTSNTAYVPQIAFFETGTIEGILNNATLTADRTWDLPDRSGPVIINTGSVYTPTNDVTDRSFDANSTTVDELADVVATIIKDLGMN